MDGKFCSIFCCSFSVINAPNKQVGSIGFVESEHSDASVRRLAWINKTFLLIRFATLPRYSLALSVRPGVVSFRACLLQDGSNIVRKMKGVFAFKVKGAGGKEGVWVVDVKNGSGAVKFGANGELR